MPAIAQWILGGLAWTLTTSVGKILTSFGLAFIVNELVVDPWVNEIAGHFGSLPGFVVGMLAWFGADKAITIIASAYTISFVSGKVTGIMKRGAASSAISS